MKIFRNTMMAAVALLIGVSLAACSDANEYEDANTNNPVFGTSHPESIEGTIWVRASGVKHGASTGKEVQGYVESLDFTLEDVDDAKQVAVTMSEGAYTDGTWVDESGTYEYTYSSVTGRLDIIKSTTDSKGNVSKTTLFTGSVAGGMITLAHFGDTPVQTYLVQQ